MTLRFNYIITIHNKENLIERVLRGVISCCGSNSHIYPVLDGCTDNTEKIIDYVSREFPTVAIHKIYAADVHEIRCINIGLKYAVQTEKGFNIILQDDVIIEEPDFEQKVSQFYEHVGYSNVGMLAFRHGVNIHLLHDRHEIDEVDLVESVYGSGMADSVLPPLRYVERMVAVRSPECISTLVVNSVGFMDERLAPYTYDNHDYSLRCLENNYKNYVFAVKYVSDVGWGGMRCNPHPEAKRIMERNRKYLYAKHKKLLSTDKTKVNGMRYCSIPTLSVPPCVVSLAFDVYKRKRKEMLGVFKYYCRIIRQKCLGFQ